MRLAIAIGSCFAVLLTISYAQTRPGSIAAPQKESRQKEYGVGGIDTGERYLRLCPPIHPNMPFEEVLKANYCFGYVRGIIDYNGVLNAFPGMVDPKKNIALSFNLFCPPENIASQEADEILRKYIEQHPDQRNRATAWIAAHAFAERYPCAAPGR